MFFGERCRSLQSLGGTGSLPVLRASLSTYRLVVLIERKDGRVDREGSAGEEVSRLYRERGVSCKSTISTQYNFTESDTKVIRACCYCSISKRGTTVAPTNFYNADLPLFSNAR